MEHALYEKITPQECIKYARTQSGKAVAGLTGFCATHDKLVAWVQSTILNNEQLGKRADTVDFWIKVAEVRRPLKLLQLLLPTC
jgi:son of sevenless-like protein